MTREEALNQYRYYNSEWYKFTFEDLLNDIYDDFEQQLQAYIEQEIVIAGYKKRIQELEAPKSCNGCVHEPLQGENYYDPCGQCKQFYGDFYEQNKDKL